MKTIVVWVLIITTQGYREPSKVVIDNIASHRACIAAARQFSTSDHDGIGTRCIPVAKMIP